MMLSVLENRNICWYLVPIYGWIMQIYHILYISSSGIRHLSFPLWGYYKQYHCKHMCPSFVEHMFSILFGICLIPFHYWEYSVDWMGVYHILVCGAGIEPTATAELHSQPCIFKVCSSCSTCEFSSHPSADLNTVAMNSCTYISFYACFTSCEVPASYGLLKKCISSTVATTCPIPTSRTEGLQFLQIFANMCVLVRVSVAVIKHSDRKKLGEERGLFCLYVHHQRPLG